MRLLAFATIYATAGCGSGGGATGPVPNAIVLGEQAAYLGFAADNCVAACLRPPAFNTAVPITQGGNATFTVTSSQPSVATGAFVTAPYSPTQSQAIALAPQHAGSATLKITGANGATAQLPVVVTTISTMTIVLDNLPTAATLSFAVSAPPGSGCSGFEGGYMFDWDVPSGATSVTLHNFPAMGAGGLSACLFTAVSVTVRDGSYAPLTQQTATIPITLGQDNPTTIHL